MTRLPQIPHKDAILVGTIAVLAFLLWRAGTGLEVLQAQLDARPALLTAHVDVRTEDFRRGPVKITRKTVTNLKDGTKTVESTREIAAEERRTETASADARKETPTVAATTFIRKRYVGLGVNPLDYTGEWRLRAGSGPRQHRARGARRRPCPRAGATPRCSRAG